ncbi:hypothetical protein [Diplocloster hominis]|uniref:5'-methylthioadenosine/S-adenosylhomocysteine nucleosidase family protein n=1 Tax=Diplocloster hominis TaxID=3079010 RepID=UPI0031BB3CEE
MGKGIRLLLVTANENETKALLNDTDFTYKTDRSDDPNDAAFYNIGKYGHYDIVHFELTDQGSVGSDASQLAIVSAINSFHPDAVILVGIAFGKEFRDSPKGQKIGDVLISEKVADYESGKMKEGKVLSDGFVAESGRQLLSAFKYYAKTWKFDINGRKANYEFGIILSGDKVVDDRNFKEKLIERYPRAIGGEMEGRGAYGACRNRNIHEWIIVKAICDWADGTKSENKNQNQMIAAESAVSFLNHIFTSPEAFEKIPKLDTKSSHNSSADLEETNNRENIIGYFINFGITTCRLFKVLRGERVLKECKVISYDESNPKSPKYLKGIIEHVRNEILPSINKNHNQIFLKTFADACFSEVFINDAKRNEFIMDFYNETNLYFNILSQKQTEENLRRLFKKLENGTAIVNIGSQFIYILVKHGNKFDMYNLKFTLKDVSDYVSKHAIPEIWNESAILKIKTFIKDHLIDEIGRVKAKNVVIIKDELKFMRNLGYPLKFEGGCDCITFEDYKKANREFLFSIDYRNEVDTATSEKSIANRLYGFKNGHIILETIFECIATETIIPSDELSIHGSLNAYIFNVAISGSSKGDRAKYMIEAHKLMTEMGATVLSPRIVNGKLSKQTLATDVRHAGAIRECDLLFISNKDGYIGDQTGREIYGAYLLNKPIAFWREPDNVERLEYIPHEEWWNLMRFLQGNED